MPINRPRSASANPARLSSRSRSSDRSRAPTASAWRASSTICWNWVRNHGSMCVIRWMFVETPSPLERAKHRPHPPVGRNRQRLLQRRGVLVLERLARRRLPEQAAALAELERSERLEKGFLERPADRHGLADRLHLRRQRAIGLRKLLERPARHLDDDVVDGRLERGRRRCA